MARFIALSFIDYPGAHHTQKYYEVENLKKLTNVNQVKFHS